MQTIQKDCRTEIVIEKSRFICTLKKVGSETEAQEFITMACFAIASLSDSCGSSTLALSAFCSKQMNQHN